jgi:hypothetical protein
VPFFKVPFRHRKNFLFKGRFFRLLIAWFTLLEAVKIGKQLEEKIGLAPFSYFCNLYFVICNFFSSSPLLPFPPSTLLWLRPQAAMGNLWFLIFHWTVG